MVDQNQIAAAVLQPHFDAVRDVFVTFCPEPGVRLSKLDGVDLLVEDWVRDSERHYAAVREDGHCIFLAPQAVSLDLEMLTAVLCHEFGHAADFCYPARWWPSRSEPAEWLSDASSRKAKQWRKAWPTRGKDQVENAADSIAHAVTGKRIGYCGPCVIQCFSGRQRPKGLR